MSLLREIQEAAIDDEVRLPTLLRKCKVLAARLGNVEFNQWVDNELNGYKTEKEVPEYRIIPVFLKRHFMGAFGSGLRNANIPVSSFPNEFIKELSEVRFTAPIASLQDLVIDDTKNSISIPLVPELLALYGQQIYERMNCMEAWKVVSNNLLVALLDTVRNRILQFVLEIESEAPDAGEAPVNSTPVPQERVNQIFNTYITGDVHNIANAGSDFSQNVEISSDLNAELFNGLIETIRQASLNQAVINQLSETIEEMRFNQGKVNFKVHYLNFMSLLADHMQVLGPAVAIYLPQLATLIR
jgi:hypothetical protein